MLTESPSLRSSPVGKKTAAEKKDEGKRLNLLTEPYRKPDRSRSLGQLGVTAGALVFLVSLMSFGLYSGFYASLGLWIPTGLFLVRLFIIQHDCGHGAFFRSRKANDTLGRILGAFTMTPYGYWKKDHAAHHATSGNLDERGVGDIKTLTLEEYVSLSRFDRVLYRAYRNPIVLFVLGPAIIFLLRYRLPLGHWIRDLDAWKSVMSTNVAIATGFLALGYVFGFLNVLLIWVPVVIVAATAGVWLFYVQHQFEGVVWRREEDWNFHESALEGCSFYMLPRWLDWLTGHIGYHHIHHLSSKIPNYRLRECHMAIPEFSRVKTLGLLESFSTVRLALWDEKKGRMVGFSEVSFLQASQTGSS